MSQKIRLPSITAPTDAGKIQQIRSYLYQLVDHLNWLFSGVDTSAQTASPQETDVFKLFAQLRPLLIRSAEILDAYREQMKNTFSTKQELEGLAASHRADMAALKMPCYEVAEAETDTQLALQLQQGQIVHIAGGLGGGAVSGTLVDVPGGAVQSPGLTFTEEGGYLCLPMQAGDRLMLLSDRPITRR